MMGKPHSTGSAARKAVIHRSPSGKRLFNAETLRRRETIYCRVHPRRATLRVGMIGTGAISNLHARAYQNIGYKITVCTDIFEEGGRRFADANGAQFVKTYEEVCRHPEVDYVDVCTFPDFRLQPLRVCAETGKHVQVQKPIATNLETARDMVDVARRG